MKRQQAFGIGLLIAALVINQQARAAVAVANGNYFIGAIDLVHPLKQSGKSPIKIQRVYNSRSQYEGLFGVGWGSDLDSYLLSQVDGSVVIQEAGGGDKTRYNAEKFTTESLAKQVERLVELKSKAPGFSNVQSYREKLLKDANFRDEETRAMGAFGQLPVGTKLYTTQRGDHQSITVIKEGFVREYSDGRQEFFTQKAEVIDKAVTANGPRILKGVYKPTRIFDPQKKASIYYTYNNKAQLTNMTDREGQTVRFSYNPSGKIVAAEDSTGKKAIYKYCESSGFDAKAACTGGDLIEVRTTDPKVFFKYKYDSIHNLVGLQGADAKTEVIAYYPSNSSEAGAVRSVAARDGILTEYKYWKDGRDPQGNYKTEVKTTYPNKKVDAASYEYFDRVRSDGSRYRYRTVTVENEKKVDTIYNECCGQPLQVNDGKGETKYEYFAGSGLLKEKVTPVEVTRWEYHPKLKSKITKITVAPKGAGKKAVSTVYEYDETNGNLMRARTTDGRGVALAYDKQNRVQAMIDQDKRKIYFKYNSSSKPAEISQEGVGSIIVSYDKDGHISGVKSQGGRQISMSVAAAFQNLVEIVKPAGIDPL